MEQSMTALPNTDSISQLAEFWDTHDLTELEDELEEVTEAVFMRPADLLVHLSPEDAEALDSMATRRKVTKSQLVSAWVHERVRSS